jgi:hypothetical protein
MEQSNASVASGRASRVESLAARLDLLESEQAIRRLCSDYCLGFDQRDARRFLGIWWEDCVWDIGPPFGRFEGLDGVEHALRQVLWPAWAHTQHVCGNHCVDVLDSDRAACTCDVDCVGALSGESTCQLVGATYTDQLERRRGAWRIRERRVAIHYFNPVPGMTLSPPAD